MDSVPPTHHSWQRWLIVGVPILGLLVLTLLVIVPDRKLSRVPGFPDTALTTADISFGTNSNVRTTLIGDDGNTYIGGDFTQVGTGAGNAATFNTGTESLITAGAFDQAVTVAIPDGAGGWYVGGDFTSVQGEVRNHLAHILPGGSVDPAFDPNVDAIVYALALDGTTLYAGGGFTTVNGGTTRNRLAAFDTTTGTANAFDPDVADGAVRVLVLNGTTLYAGGTFTSFNALLTGGTMRKGLAAFDTTTSVATAFDAVLDVNDSVYALALDDTTLYVGGYLHWFGGDSRTNLASVDATTGTVTAFDPNVNAQVSALALDDTTLYAGGEFTDVNGGTTRNNLAAFDTTADTANVTPFDPNVNSTVTTLAVNGTTLYAGGGFTTVNGGTTRNRLAAFDTTADTVNVTPFDPNVNSTVTTLALDGTTLFVGGNFNLLDFVTRPHLASFVTATGEVTDFDPNVFGLPYALALDGTTLYVGGDFTDVNDGTTRNYLAAFDATTGTATDFDPNLDGVVNALVLDGTTLYAGGDFTTVNGSATRNRIAAFDTTADIINVTEFDPVNVNAEEGSSSVNALALDGTTLYAGGSFYGVNDPLVFRDGLAAFDKTTGVVTAFNPDVNGTVHALVLDGTTLYVGGEFNTVNGLVDSDPPFVLRSMLAAFDTTTNTNNVTAFNPDVNGTVTDLALGGTTLYAGGTFTGTNTDFATLRTNLAAFDTTTDTDNATDFDPSVGGTVTALSLNGTNLAVGGGFSTVGGLPKLRFALFEDLAPDPTPTPTDTPTATPSPTPDEGGTSTGGFIPGAPTPTLSPSVTSSPLPTVRPETYGLREGDTISAANSDDPDIYILNEWGYKRLFLNPIIFSFYGHLGGFRNVHPAAPGTRDAFVTSGLFRNCETNDPKIYATEITGEDTGILHWLNMSGDEAVRQDPDFFHKVFCINNNEFNWYPKGSPWTSLSQVPTYRR